MKAVEKKRKQHYKEKSTSEKKKAMEIDKKLEANECLFFQVAAAARSVAVEAVASTLSSKSRVKKVTLVGLSKLGKP